MAALTAHTSNITDSIKPVSHQSIHQCRPVIYMTRYKGCKSKKYLQHRQQPEGILMIKNQEMLESFWSARLSFT